MNSGLRIASVPVRVLAVSLAAGLDSARAADIQDFEIGYLKITQWSDRNQLTESVFEPDPALPKSELIHVTARCIKATDLIETIAKVADLDVVFDRDYESYVSVHFRGTFQTPLKWIDYVANSSGHLHIKVEDGRVIVNRIDDSPRYQAELTASEVEESFKTTLESEVRPQSGIERGLYFYAGHFIPPPYQVDHAGTDDGGYDIRINGVKYRRVSGPPPTRPPSAPPELPESSQFESSNDLSQYITRVLYPGLLRDHDPSEARKLVLSFVESQDIFVSFFDADAREIAVVFRTSTGREIPQDIFPVNYDFETGVPMEIPQPSAAERMQAAEKNVARTRDALERGAVIFCASDGGIVEFSGRSGLEHLQQIVEAIGMVDTLQLECLISEIVEGRLMARELAIYLPPRKNELLAQISAELQVVR